MILALAFPEIPDLSQLGLPGVLAEPLTWLLGALAYGIAIVASGHAILRKREVRAAIGWVGVIWIAPILGSLAYALLGVNRIHRRAVSIFGEGSVRQGAARVPLIELDPDYLQSGIGRLVDGLVRRRMLPGNRIEPLVGGDDAFAAMLQAIAGAKSSVALETYIFDNDPSGLEFAAVLEDAVARGVEVRVLIDAVGNRYSRPRMSRELSRRGIESRRFLPTVLPWRFPYVNLRNHRKILVVDGRLGFCGGMNIRHGHRISAELPERVDDVHFAIEGPVVADLQHVFVEDWQFAAGETLAGETWFPDLDIAGEVAARAVADGPDHNLDKIRWTLLGAIACAKYRLAIQTPYFLPNPDLGAALEVAARRGVQVDVLVPERTNLRLVEWASRSMRGELLEAGVRMWLVRGPFDHTKLMVMDDRWSFIGSSNWDPRSLRLNFELNLECWSAALNQRLDRILDEKKERSRRLSLDEYRKRTLGVRLRDGATALFSPYL